MFRHRLPGLTLGLAAVLCVPSLAPAQAKNDLLEQQRRLTKVAADKMEAQATEALAEARKLAATDPARASSILRELLRQLEADNALTEARRASLVRTTKDRLAGLPQGKAAEKAPAKGDAAADEAKIISRTLELIDKLQREGRTAEAGRMAADLSRQYPNNPAVQAAARTNSVIGQIKTGRETTGETDQRFVGTLTQVDKSAVPVDGDLELPKDWFKKMAARKNVNEPVLTEKEQAILKALNSTIKPEYKDAGFLDVLDDLSQKLKITFAVDKTSLADAGVTSDTQVSLNLPRGVTARTALRKILADVGLTYIIKGETVQVITPAKAKETMVTRRYYIGNLLAGGPYADAGIRFNPWFDQIQVMQNVKSLIDLIQGTIDPDSWHANGGAGTIAFHAPTMSLVIRQTAEVHGMMGGSSPLK